MEGVEERIQRSASFIREIVLTFLGAGIQTIFSLDLIRESVQGILNGAPTISFGSLPFVIGFVTIIVPYCISASMAFSPKRLINPMWVHLLTFVFSTLIISEAISASNSSALNQYLSSYHITPAILIGSFSILYFMVFFVIGLIQWLFVRLLVGLNGTETDLDIKTFSLDVDFKTVSKALKQSDLQSVGNLGRRQETADLLLLSNLPRGVGDKLVLCAYSDPDDSTKTLVSTAAFTANNFSIRQTISASAWMKSVRLYLEDALGKKGTESSKESAGRSLAVSFALRRTVASIGGIRDVPKYYLFAIGVTIAMGIVFTAGFFIFQIIPEPEYLGALVLIFVALVIELGPAIAESVYRRRESQTPS